MNIQFFCYSTGAMALTAVVGNTASATVSIGSDADFQLQYLTYVAEQVTVAVVNFTGLIQINDSAVGRTFFDQPVPIQSVAGTGAQPYVILNPRLVRANSSLTVSLVQRQAVATNVFLVLHGYKMLPE